MRKVARRRRDGRRESNKQQIFVISPSVIFQKKNDSSLVRGSLWRTTARVVPTGVSMFLCHFSRELSYINNNSLTAAASHRPTVSSFASYLSQQPLGLSLTHYTTPPFPQKSRSVRLFGCKRPHDGSLSLPIFAVVCGFVSQSLRVAYGNPPPFTREAEYAAVWIQPKNHNKKRSHFVSVFNLT